MAGSNQRLRSIAGLLALWSCATTAAALTSPTYRFQFPFTEDTSLQSRVFHIAQDRNRFIWFAHARNLERYDGIRLVNVETPWGSRLTDLVADQQGDIWVGTNLHGLQIWDADAQRMQGWKAPAGGHQPATHVTALAVDRDGLLWVGSPDGELTGIDVRAGSTIRIDAESISGAAATPAPITELTADVRGFVWIGSTDGRLFRLEPATQEVDAVEIEVGDHAITALLAEGDRLWVGTDDGRLIPVSTGRLEAGATVDVGPPSGDGPVGVVAMASDRHGRIWVGTEQGLRLMTPSDGEIRPLPIRADRTDDAATEAVYALYLDRSGVMWIASAEAGVATATTRASAFRYWQPGRRGSQPPVTAIEAGDDGTLWVGTFRDGLYRRDPDGRIRRYGRSDAIFGTSDGQEEHPNVYETSAMALHLDRLGQLWIGTLRRGLVRLDPTTETFTVYRTDPRDPTTLSNPTVTTLAERPNGDLWVGTFAGGLNLLDTDSGTFSALRHDPEDPGSLSEDQVRAVLEDSSGRLWVGTRSAGLNVRLPGSDRFLRLRHDPRDPTSLAHDSIVAISEDADGRVWLGTYAGLLRADVSGETITFRRYGRAEGLLGRKVYSILGDTEGFLWLSSSRGISKFDPAAEVFVNLGMDHGLPPSGFNYGAYAAGSDGSLHYGSQYGVTSFDPLETLLDPYTPEIILTGVTTTQSSPGLAPPRHLELPHDQALVTFEFSLLDFGAPDRNHYQHFLEDFDEEWVDVGTHQRATYSNLPPGRYTFRVRGANSEGVWSSSEATMSLEILPPPWATWWAYVGYVTAALGLILLYARHQSRRQRREAIYTQRLEREVHLRTRELEEQNEKLRYANELLEVASVTDSLTGVRNRRFLLTTIDQDIALVDRAFASNREDRENAAFVFILFDLDGFKEINDTYGHSAGDLALYQVRDLLAQACRTSDTLVRWGGDEFLIVAREATREHIETLVERIRESVSEHEFDIGTDTPVRLTCSLGFACYPFVTESPKLYSWEEVIDIADRALYIAKRHGPNMWAGIFGTDRTHETPSEDLLTLILERPELLSAEGSIRLVTSHPTPVGLPTESESRHAS